MKFSSNAWQRSSFNLAICRFLVLDSTNSGPAMFMSGYRLPSKLILIFDFRVRVENLDRTMTEFKEV